MGKIFTLKRLSLLSMVMVICFTSYGQTTVSGTITEASSGEPLVGVNIVVKGKVVGTITDFDGNFQLSTTEAPPLTLVFSIIGFAAQELDITQSNVQGLNIAMEEQAFLGQEVVVSASRVQESILESPVTIEKLDILAIRETAAPSFYEALGNLKGVDFSTQSLTFKSINTRGFGANGNTRFVQLIDGIDNQAPGLNFPVGNIVGINDLDLESAELIPGAASALYGPNAIQGILLLNSKSPFEYQGLSAYSKLGVNHIDGEDDDASLYQDYGIRYAKAFNNKFAFKVTGSYLRANDFRGVDERDQSSGVVESGEVGRSPGNRTFDGVNIYGDFGFNINQAVGETFNSFFPEVEDRQFTPTGFSESSFVDNTTESIKVGGALHYRFTDNLEGIAQFNWGSGSTVYTANDRFVLDGFRIYTAKLELRNPNWYVRAYTTQESSGDSYAANTVASLINQQTYLPNYIGALLNSRVFNGRSIADAHADARAIADAGQPLPGSPVFDGLFNDIINRPIGEVADEVTIAGQTFQDVGGARFQDETGLWHAEGSYNFQELVEAVDIVAGANYRRFNLVSDGTLFALDDAGDEISFNEWGAYVQLSKALIDDRLKLQASARYDKNENFDGQFSPRASAVYTIGGDHNIRASFQRGFRIPTTQDQFIDLDVTTRRLVGSNRLLVDRFGFETNTVYNTADLNAVRNGELAAEDLQPETRVSDEFETEKVSTFEVGYKGLLFDGRLLIDGYYYYSRYQDFIAEIDLSQAVSTADEQPRDGFDPVDGFNPNSAEGRQDIIEGDIAGGRIQRFGFDINAAGNVESQGWALGMEYSLPKGYKASGNISFNELISQSDLTAQGFNAQFNTPRYRYNLGLSNREVIENFGFNVTWRWQQAFLWESAIGTGVIPSFGTLDAQVSYKLPSLKSILKVGGSNILNERYTTSFANPRLGAIYYVQITFDQFLN